MNCPNCHKDVPTPCRNSNDLAGCVRFHDPIHKPEAKQNKISNPALEAMYMRLYQAAEMCEHVLMLGRFCHAYTADNIAKLQAIETQLKHSFKVVQAMIDDAEGVDDEQKD